MMVPNPGLMDLGPLVRLRPGGATGGPFGVWMVGGGIFNTGTYRTRSFGGGGGAPSAPGQRARIEPPAEPPAVEPEGQAEPEPEVMLHPDPGQGPVLARAPSPMSAPLLLPRLPGPA